MTFFMIGGIVCTMSAMVCIVIYLIAHKMDDHSTAAKIIIWVGMLLGVAGASLLTIEYSFPNISHPKQPDPPYVPTVYDHFVEYYGDTYYTFIKENTEHTIVDEFITVKHTQLNSGEKCEYTFTNFRTDVLYVVDESFYDISILNEYTYNADYTYQNILSKEIK